ncbi:MAG: 3'-5' exonuclease [Polyangiaceae bacterium]|nr:3'-5' exonuclease [Polyangiaceae bacterium]
MKLGEPCGCFPTGRHYPGIAHLLRVRVGGLASELEPDAGWVDLPIACIDTETTGREAGVDRIVEIGIVVGRGGEVLERRSWLCNPGIPIPASASAIHGITDEAVADKPSLAEIAAEVMAFLAGRLPAAYNAPFDKGFLLAELERVGALGAAEATPPPALRREVEWLDPLVFARELYKALESRSLGAMCEQLGVTLERAHRATDDAEAALRVLYALAKDARLPASYAALVQEQKRLGRQQDEARRFWRNR